MSLPTEYAGRTAIVSGAGDGIGAMLARGLAGRGMSIGVLDVRADAAERIAAEIGGDAFSIVADVSRRESVREASESVRERGRAVALLWINAGVGAAEGIVAARARTVEWVYGVNVLGAIWTAQAFVPLLDVDRGPCHVGVTASSASLVAPDPPLTLYAASKQATFGVAEALRAELAGQGIGTTILCPGILNTTIWDSARARPERFGGPRRMDPGVAGRWQAAPSPDALWPRVEHAIATGGGYLVAATEAATRPRFESRHEAIRRGWHVL